MIINRIFPAKCQLQSDRVEEQPVLPGQTWASAIRSAVLYLSRSAQHPPDDPHANIYSYQNRYNHEKEGDYHAHLLIIHRNLPEILLRILLFKGQSVTQ
jgi:hypothetical protein